MIFMMKLKIKLCVVFHLKVKTRFKRFLLFILIIQDSLYIRLEVVTNVS